MRRTLCDFVNRFVSRTIAARISIVDALASGSTPAGVGHADDQVEVAHRLGEHDGGHRVDWLVQVLAAPVEVHALDRGQLDFGRREAAVEELDASSDAVVMEHVRDVPVDGSVTHSRRPHSAIAWRGWIWCPS